jgi:hypothetical protein
VVAGDEVVLRDRAELADATGRIRKNAYQAGRSLEPAAAAELVAAAERIAAERAAAEIGRVVRKARGSGADVRSCAVVVGATTRAPPLESILRSHALAHAAEGRLYQDALLQGADACGLDAVAVSKQSLTEEHELREWSDGLRRRLGPPWAEDQKLAALAACIALRR